MPANRKPIANAHRVLPMRRLIHSTTTVAMLARQARTTVSVTSPMVAVQPVSSNECRFWPLVSRTYALDVPEASFDVLLCSYMFDLLPERERRGRHAGERPLREHPGGRIRQRRHQRGADDDGEPGHHPPQSAVLRDLEGVAPVVEDPDEKEEGAGGEAVADHGEHPTLDADRGESERAEHHEPEVGDRGPGDQPLQVIAVVDADFVLSIPESLDPAAAAPLQEGQRVQPDVDRHDHAQRRVDVLQLLAGQRQADVVKTEPAILLRNRQPENPGLAHLVDDVPAVILLGIPLPDMRGRFTFVQIAVPSRTD